MLGIVGYFALHLAYKNDYKNMTVYDGCYEQYASNEMPAEAFRPFMQDCMDSK